MTSAFSSNAAAYRDENPVAPPEPTNALSDAPAQQVRDLVEYKEQPQMYRELIPDTNDELYNSAIRANPALRKTWIDHEQNEMTEGFSFPEAVWNSIIRDSFIGNSYRVLDQTIEELNRTDKHAVAIWDARETLTVGISPQYHDDILNAPTIDLAIRESQRIRNREIKLKKEYNTHMGKSLVADIAGFMLDPSNLLPGYGMLKTYNLATRTKALGALQNIAASSKAQQMSTLAAAGAFEEAIRMAPRYASDPTFEVNNYMEGIAMSAAFSGLLPLVFGGIGSGVGRLTEILPNAANDIGAISHAYGMDVGVRQAMRFPGKLKETGFKDPGTALRKSKEAAQDAVNTKVKEVNARTNTRQFNDALTQDMAGDAPSNNKIVSWIDDQLDKAGNTALDRAKLKLRRAGVSTAATLGAAAVGGPLAGITTAALFANKDYLAIAAKVAIRKKNIRRAGYDAAITAGDTKRATDILRETRQSKGQTDIAMTIDVVEEQIASAVDKAKVKLRTINEQSRVCT